VASSFISLLLVSVLGAPLDATTAHELRYSGTLTQRGRNAAGTPVKQFSVYCLLMPAEGKARELLFLVDEQGGGAWAWPERFGTIGLNANNRPTGRAEVRVLHTHNDIPHPLSVQQPLFEYADRLAEDARWNAGRFAYQVTRSRKVGERDCWEVEVSNNFGRVQTLQVEKGSGLVIAADRRVFMGQGDEFSLKTTLDSVETVNGDQLTKLQPPIKTLQQLQQDMKRDANSTKPELNDDQVKLAAAVIDQLEKESADTPFSRLAAVISRDVKSQARRFEDVKDLAQRFVGSKAPALELKSLTNQAIPAEDLEDKIIVLHFWEYQGDPLEEPYGQVGYLDYLYNRRHKLGVAVYGIGVDDRLADAPQTGAALRSIRKLRDFMNLSYPVAVDDGRLLKKFGDPRVIGAKLPLWVVIAPDGTIAHYEVGYYDIRPDEGLRQLDEVVVDLIRKQRAESN
jgi:peroxiredoxin